MGYGFEILINQFPQINTRIQHIQNALGKPSEKNRKIYDILQMGGWVANSKHDLFSIKNYDIIVGRVGDRLP